MTLIADLPDLPDLPDALQKLIDQVPTGKVTTYGDLARALGSVSASRWVGSLLLHDSRSLGWPSHRVIRSDGSLGKYAHGGLRDKAERLRAEGVPVIDDHVDLSEFGQTTLKSDRPLEALRALQDELPARCILHRETAQVRTAAGLDVSYARENVGIGGYALVDADSGELLWSTTVRCRVEFPYISSFLAFRELPVLAALYDAARVANRLADVYLIDGAGIMHPRRSGVATHFGILADVPTIGVTKKLLAGSFDADGAAALEPRDVTDGNETLGVAMRPRDASKKFIWTSPGHRMDVAGAASITLQMLRGRRLPEPIYWADRLSRQACSAEE